MRTYMWLVVSDTWVKDYHAGIVIDRASGWYGRIQPNCYAYLRKYAMSWHEY